MRSSEFVPLGGGAPAGGDAFRPLLGEPTTPVAPAEDHAAAAAEAARAEESQRAFQAGYELGRREAHAQVESVGESFVKALEELGEFRARLRDRYERELLEVALGVARKVVQQELAERPQIWLGMIRDAIRRVVDRERITVRVPGPLARFLSETGAELRSQLDGVKELDVVEDAGLPVGGCVIECRFGEVDIGVETQIEAAERVLVRAEE